jgi:P2-related tail formation protein
MYKTTYSSDDRTPEILDKLNQSINIGFKNMEDLVNQIIDLLDANVLQEPLLIYLANLFNLRLRSSDPTRWRKQIKKAVPLNKSKGTIRALKEALNDAGIELDKFSQLWQVGTKYTFTESFVYLNDNIFQLEKVSLDKNDIYFSFQVAKSSINGNSIVIDNYDEYIVVVFF